MRVGSRLGAPSRNIICYIKVDHGYRQLRPQRRRARACHGLGACVCRAAAVREGLRCRQHQRKRGRHRAGGGFFRELDKLKNSFGELGKKMDDSAKAIDGYTDVEKTRKEIEDLRGAVSGLLDAVTDNGALATLGDKALTRARDKLKELEQDTRFKPEEKNFLIEQWRKLRDDTERANQELGSARSRFAELLRTLQANRGFHRRARADPASAEGHRRHPPVDPRYTWRLRSAAAPDRRDQASGSVRWTARRLPILRALDRAMSQLARRRMSVLSRSKPFRSRRRRPCFISIP